MTDKELMTLTENNVIEFKLSQSGLSKDFFESYSSFANTAGGTIFLGVLEKEGKIVSVPGVSDYKKTIKDLFDNLNNREKVSANIIDDSCIEVINMEGGKKVVSVKVPEANREQKPIYINNNILLSYKRNFKGDYKVTQNELMSMLNDRYGSSNDCEVNSRNLDFESIDLTTLKSFRGIFDSNNPGNIFAKLSDEDFCKQTGILRKDAENHYLLSNAAVLFFTNNIAITSIYPNYFVDYQEAISGVTRWDYRLMSMDYTWTGNLFDFFGQVFARLQIGLPNAFHNENGVESRFNHLDDAIKEALVNAFSNADFFQPNPILIRKEPTVISVANSGRPIIGLQAMIEGGNTNPRNKEIMRFFRLLMYSQRSGYGIPNIISIFKANNLPTPSFAENASPDMTTLTLMLIGQNLRGLNKVSPGDVLLAIKTSNGVSTFDLSERFHCDYRTMKTVLDYLLSQNLIFDNGKKTKGKLYFAR